MPDTSSEYVDVPFRISRETAVELSKLDELVEGLNELKNVAQGWIADSPANAELG
jgi:hypothetical protein